MKTNFFILSLFMSHQSLALTTIYDGPDSISADKYIKLNLHQEVPKTNVIEHSAMRPGLPAKSELQAGIFDAYKLSECQKYPTPFFVIGSDELSMAWLDKHRAHLKDIHAFGFVTNIHSEKELKEAETVSPIHLIPSNVDALAQAVKAPAYPFFTNGCEVWQ